LRFWLKILAKIGQGHKGGVSPPGLASSLSSAYGPVAQAFQPVPPGFNLNRCRFAPSPQRYFLAPLGAAWSRLTMQVHPGNFPLLSRYCSGAGNRCGIYLLGSFFCFPVFEDGTGLPMSLTRERVED